MTGNNNGTSTLSGTVRQMLRPDICFWIIAIAGLLFRIEYLREFSQLPHFAYAVGPDVQDYHDRALGILAGHFFPAEPDIHAPLYSCFLALLYRFTGNSVGWVRAIQLFLNWAAWVWLAKILKNSGTAIKTVLCFLALAMFTPVTVFHNAEIISESLLLPLTAVCIYCFLRAEKENFPAGKKWLFFAGTAAGAGIITHGFFLAFAAAEAGFMAWKKQWQRGLLFCAGIALVTLPVIAAKSIFYERMTGLQANSMFNIYLGNNPSADGGCYLRPGRPWEQEHRNTAREAAERKISVNRLYLERMISFYKDSPGALVTLPVKKLWKLILPVEFISGADSPAMIYKTPLQYHLRFLANITGLLAVIGVFMLLFRKLPASGKHFFILTAALAAAQIISVTSGRYRMGMMPGIMLLGAYAAAALNKRQLVITTLGIIMLTVMLPDVKRIDPEERSLTGEVYLRQGKLDEAENALAYAAEYMDDPTRFCNMRGIIAEKQNRLDDAERFYRMALDEFNPQGHFNLGMMLSKTAPEQRTLASALLVAGLKLDGNRPDVWNQLGVNFVYENNLFLAEQAVAEAVKLAPTHPGYRKNLDLIRSLRRKTAEKP